MKRLSSNRRKYSGERCISCGKPIELARSGLPNHHCSKRHIAVREKANRREEQIDPFPELSFGERLSIGFSMLEGSTPW